VRPLGVVHVMWPGWVWVRAQPGGLLGAVIMAADGRMSSKTTHVDRATADAKLTRECERNRAARRAGEISEAEAASQIEATHARRDASIAGNGHL
jgi:hypothetical protein